MTSPENGRFVSDTHAFVWHLQESDRLSAEARKRFLSADQGESLIYLSAMTPVEIVYLVEKRRVPEKIMEIMREKILSNPRESYQIVDLSYEIALSVSKVPRETVPELPDRIITATAHFLQLPLITRDSQIRQWEGIVTLW